MALSDVYFEMTVPDTSTLFIHLEKTKSSVYVGHDSHFVLV